MSCQCPTQKIHNSNTSNNTINKSNVTLWKSKYNQGTTTAYNEEDKKIENEYIENLKKQRTL